MIMRNDVAITDRIGNGIVAGFIATFVMSALHEPVALVTAAVGLHAPLGLLFHFFVGTLLWGGAFGIAHDWLSGPSWARRVVRERNRSCRDVGCCAANRLGLPLPETRRAGADRGRAVSPVVRRDSRSRLRQARGH